MRDLLLHVERYLDGMPREHARVEEVGPFTLFAGDPDGWTFCARPTLPHRDRKGASPSQYDQASVRQVLQRLRDLGLPEVIEWVHEMTPDLLDAVRACGDLTIEEIPLMVLGSHRPTLDPPPDVSVRVLGPSDLHALAEARAVSSLAFATPGTCVGATGVTEREAAVEPVPEPVADVIRQGKVGWVVAQHDMFGVIASGRHLPFGDTTEVVGVATLPAFRRQGLAAAVTGALVTHAIAGGTKTVFLTASSADVAHLYAGLGFERIGTGYAAQRD